jgi:hypothetical protein
LSDKGTKKKRWFALAPESADYLLDILDEGRGFVRDANWDAKAVVDALDVSALIEAGCMGDVELKKGRFLACLFEEAMLAAGRVDELNRWMDRLNPKKLDPCRRAIRLASHDKERARCALEEVRAKQSTDIRPALALASVFGDFDEAERELSALEHRASSVRGRCNVAQARFSAIGDEAGAARLLRAAEGQVWERVDKLRAGHQLYFLTRAWAMLGRRDEAIRTLYAIEQVESVATGFANAAVLWLLLLFDQEESRRLLHLAIQQSNEDGSTYAIASVAKRCALLQDIDSAKDCLARAEEHATDVYDWCDLADAWAAIFSDDERTRWSLEQGERVIESRRDGNELSWHYRSLLGDKVAAARCTRIARKKNG